MIKLSALYPNGDGIRFDMAYYVNRHIPLVQKLLGPALKGVSVEQGISSMQPGSPAPYVAAGHLLFESIESFQASFGANLQAILDDVPKYTNAQPVVQIGEVKL